MPLLLLLFITNHLKRKYKLVSEIQSQSELEKAEVYVIHFSISKENNKWKKEENKTQYIPASNLKHKQIFNKIN